MALASLSVPCPATGPALLARLYSFVGEHRRVARAAPFAWAPKRRRGHSSSGADFGISSRQRRGGTLHLLVFNVRLGSRASLSCM
jgi:hypothetical protein